MNHEQLNDLTLENFSEKTGKRFRTTPSQKARGLTREEAFAEWKNSQLAVAVKDSSDAV